MKMLKTLIAACLLTVATGYSAELSEADKKWSEAVEKMVSAGSATISTPHEHRAKLAKEIASRLGREAQTQKTDKGYKIVVSAGQTKTAELAKATEK